MKNIVFIGDIHTSTVFRMAGVETVGADDKTARQMLTELSSSRSVPVIIITSELAQHMIDLVRSINLQSSGPVIIEIPGIDDFRGFGKSAMEYITEALGISL